MADYSVGSKKRCSSVERDCTRTSLLSGLEKEGPLMKYLRVISRSRIFASIGGLTIAGVALAAGARTSQAAFIDGGNAPQLLIGTDEDRQDNAALQAGAGAN